MKRILYFTVLVIVILILTFGVVELITYITHSETVGDWVFYIIVGATTSFASSRSDYIKDKFFKK